MSNLKKGDVFRIKSEDHISEGYRGLVGVILSGPSNSGWVDVSLFEAPDRISTRVSNLEPLDGQP